MVGWSALTLLLAVALAPTADSAHLVEEVTDFYNKKINFVGHDNGLRRHITSLENDFEELDNLDNEAWQHAHVQKLLTSLTNAVTVKESRRSRHFAGKNLEDRCDWTGDSFESIQEAGGWPIVHRQHLQWDHGPCRKAYQGLE